MLHNTYYAITYATEDLARQRFPVGVGKTVYASSELVCWREEPYAESIEKKTDVTVLDLIAAGQLDVAAVLMWFNTGVTTIDTCNKEVRRIASKWGVPTDALR